MTEIDRTHAWWTNADIEIHCVCDRYIQIGDMGSGIVKCKNCGQEYYYKEYHVKILDVP